MLLPLLIAAAALQGCKPLPGAAQLWNNPRTRFIMVGEMHGTAQTPAVFADLVCDARLAHRPLLIGVEEAEFTQPAIDAFVSTTPLRAAERRFKKSPIWTNDFKDGRSSRAYFDLFVRLRAAERFGLIKNIVAFQPVTIGTKPVSGSEFNEMMAERLEQAAKRFPSALVIALVGNVHARKLPLQVGSAKIDPAASFLPARQTVSLNVPAKGQAWNCEDVCGPHNENGDIRSGYGVYIGAFNSAYDGEIRLNEPATASAPLIASHNH